jgi:hypothetical protein
MPWAITNKNGNSIFFGAFVPLAALVLQKLAGGEEIRGVGLPNF